MILAEEPRTAVELLRDRRDELQDDLVEELRDRGRTVSGTAFELDDELADVNHLAVVDGLEAIAAALRTADGPLDELGALLSVRMPGDPPTPPASDGAPAPLPVAPVPVDPDTLPFDEDDDEQDRADAVRERLQSNMTDQAWHLRALMDHATELLETVAYCAQHADVHGARQVLTGRRPLVEALVATLSAWEVAVCAYDDGSPGSAGIASEQIELLGRWLAAPDGIRG